MGGQDTPVTQACPGFCCFKWPALAPHRHLDLGATCRHQSLLILTSGSFRAAPCLSSWSWWLSDRQRGLLPPETSMQLAQKAAHHPHTGGRTLRVSPGKGFPDGAYRGLRSQAGRRAGIACPGKAETFIVGFEQQPGALPWVASRRTGNSEWVKKQPGRQGDVWLFF